MFVIFSFGFFPFPLPPPPPLPPILDHGPKISNVLDGFPLYLHLNVYVYVVLNCRLYLSILGKYSNFFVDTTRTNRMRASARVRVRVCFHFKTYKIEIYERLERVKIKSFFYSTLLAFQNFGAEKFTTPNSRRTPFSGNISPLQRLFIRGHDACKRLAGARIRYYNLFSYLIRREHTQNIRSNLEAEKKDTVTDKVLRRITTEENV